MKLQDMMIRNVIQIAPAESIGTAAKRMSGVGGRLSGGNGERCCEGNYYPFELGWE
jgi:hypothetical protein